MRVLQLTQRFPPAIGGVETHVYHLAAGLQRAGIDVEVAATDLRRDVPFERLAPEHEGYPFPVRRHASVRLAVIPHGLGVVAPSMLLDALGHQAEVVHAHGYGYFPTWAGGLARSLDGVAFVVTPHSDRGGVSLSKRAFDRFVPRLTLCRASRVIALTHHEASRLETLGVDADRIAVIPNGVDLAEFGEPPARTDHAGVTVLFVGRLDPSQKGLEFLVRALARLPASADVHLRLVGEDWGGLANVRALASQLGVRDRIALIGSLSRAELLQEYARSDLFVLPSRFEPFGIVLLEAMAAGLPVIASRVGGIPEVVADGETGLLVEPGDVEGLAGAMLRLAMDPALRASLGSRGRERARSYSWDVVVPQVLATYREALEERV